MASVLKGHVVPTFIIVWQWFAISISHISVNANGNQKWQLTKNTVFQRSIHMYNNPFMSDIKFIYKGYFGDEELYAHKYMLATSSPVFHQMFYGDSPINEPVIDLRDISKEILEAFLAFIYKDECPKDIGVMFGVLRLTKKYEIPSFDEVCRNDLEQKGSQKITATQAFEYLEIFVELNEHTMMELCWRYIDKYTDDFFASQYFLNMKQSTLDSLLARDTLSSNEKAIFKAVVKWANHQCSLRRWQQIRDNRREILGDTIYKIRFHTITGELSTWDLILSDSEVVGLQKAIMNGENVQNLNWDLSKQKRGMGTYFDTIIKTMIIGLFILFIGFVFLKINFRPLKYVIIVSLVVTYLFPNIAWKLMPNFIAKWF